MGWCKGAREHAIQTLKCGNCPQQRISRIQQKGTSVLDSFESKVLVNLAEASSI